MKTNFKFGEVFDLSESIRIESDRINFLNIFETDNGSINLLALKEGQNLDTHIASFEVMVLVLNGEVEFTMIDRKHTIKTGQFLLMGANVPHSVNAKSDSKLLLIKVK